jgi:hypothetical protein
MRGCEEWVPRYTEIEKKTTEKGTTLLDMLLPTAVVAERWWLLSRIVVSKKKKKQAKKTYRYKGWTRRSIPCPRYPLFSAVAVRGGTDVVREMGVRRR